MEKPELSLDKPQIICHVEKSINYTLFDCKWIPKTAKFVVVGSEPRGTGVIEMFEINSTDIKPLDKVIVKNDFITRVIRMILTEKFDYVPSQIETSNSLKCASFGISPTGKKLLACGNFEGNLDVW